VKRLYSLVARRIDTTLWYIAKTATFKKIIFSLVFESKLLNQVYRRFACLGQDQIFSSESNFR